MINRGFRLFFSIAVIVVTAIAVSGQTTLEPGDPVIFTAASTPIYAYPDENSAIIAIQPQGYVDRLGPAEANIGEWYYIAQQVGYVRLDESGLQRQTEALQQQLIESVTLEIVQDATISDAFKRRATLFAHMDNYEMAIADYTTAIELSSTEAHAFALRGWTYRQMRDYEASIADLHHAIELGASDAFTLISLGVSYGRLQNNDEAEHWYLEALERYPEAFYAHNNLGGIAFDRQEYSLALNYYDQATSINIYGAYPYSNRSLVYERQNNPTAALNELTTANLVNPYEPSILVDLAEYYAFDLDDSSSGLRYIDDALNIDPDYSPAFEARAVINAYEVGDGMAAISDFYTAIALDPYNISAIDRAGIFFARLGDFETAREFYDTQAEFGGLRPLYYLYSAQIYFGLGQYDDVKHELTTFFENGESDFRNDLTVGYLIQGMTALQQGDYELAYESYDVAFLITPEWTRDWLEKRGYRLIDSRSSMAQEYIQQIASDPSDAENYLQLAHILMEFGVWDEAISNYQQYLAMSFNPELDAMVMMIQAHLNGG
ncbi:MAG: tetratricopeptide repeat protein [Aggregatilineales bacterium]